jgi:hypothetical protein
VESSWLNLPSAAAQNDEELIVDVIVKKMELGKMDYKCRHVCFELVNSWLLGQEFRKNILKYCSNLRTQFKLNISKHCVFVDQLRRKHKFLTYSLASRPQSIAKKWVYVMS